MIAYLRGTLWETSMDTAIVLSQGVGYEILCSQFNLEELGSKRGQDVQMHIHTHVREDALQLFGFLTKVEKQFFLSLIKINGIGPKMALHILSGAPLQRIVEMIEKEDVKGLSKLPKVGKKTAEQMILSMKGKLVLGETQVVKPTTHRELVSALNNLGFKSQDVEKVVTDLPQDIELQEGLRQSLAALTSL